MKKHLKQNTIKLMQRGGNCSSYHAALVVHGKIPDQSLQVSISNISTPGQKFAASVPVVGEQKRIRDTYTNITRLITTFSDVKLKITDPIQNKLTSYKTVNTTSVFQNKIDLINITLESITNLSDKIKHTTTSFDTSIKTIKNNNNNNTKNIKKEFYKLIIYFIYIGYNYSYLCILVTTIYAFNNKYSVPEKTTTNTKNTSYDDFVNINKNLSTNSYAANLNNFDNIKLIAQHTLNLLRIIYRIIVQIENIIGDPHTKTKISDAAKTNKENFIKMLECILKIEFFFYQTKNLNTEQTRNIELIYICKQSDKIYNDLHKIFIDLPENKTNVGGSRHKKRLSLKRNKLQTRNKQNHNSRKTRNTKKTQKNTINKNNT